MRCYLSGTLSFCLLASSSAFFAAEKQLAGGSDPRAAQVQGNTLFGFDLYAQVRDQEGNLFFSPYGISSGMALLYAGARGQTGQQMAEVFHFVPSQSAPQPAGAARRIGRNGPGPGSQLRLANALWTDRGHPPLPEFLRVAKTRPGAGAFAVDFTGAPEKTRQAMNTWVAGQTQNKIKDLLKSGTITAQTRLVLTNAVYFKAPWATAFPREQTHQAPFQQADGRKVIVPLMSQTQEYNFLEEKTFQTLELPYTRGAFSLVIFLPKKADGLPALERMFTPDRVARVLSRLTRQKVEVHLPRFQMVAQADLKPILVEMGMPLAFSDRADFSGIDGSKNLTLSLVVHQAFLDVNEEGTEAAAATGSVVVAKGWSQTPTFRADHPFVFLIRNTHSGEILFLGRISELKHGSGASALTGG